MVLLKNELPEQLKMINAALDHAAQHYVYKLPIVDVILIYLRPDGFQPQLPPGLEKIVPSCLHQTIFDAIYRAADQRIGRYEHLLNSNEAQ